MESWDARFDSSPKRTLPRLLSSARKHNRALPREVHLRFKQMGHRVVIESVLGTVVLRPK